MEICAYMLTIDGIYGKDSNDRRSHFTQTKPNQCVTSGHSGSDKVRPSSYDVVRRLLRRRRASGPVRIQRSIKNEDRDSKFDRDSRSFLFFVSLFLISGVKKLREVGVNGFCK